MGVVVLVIHDRGVFIPIRQFVNIGLVFRDLDVVVVVGGDIVGLVIGLVAVIRIDLISPFVIVPLIADIVDRFIIERTAPTDNGKH